MDRKLFSLPETSRKLFSTCSSFLIYKPGSMVWALFSTAFFQGLLGSTHCVGMCGPFVAILQTRDGAGIFSNLSYNFGRTVSYACIGGVLGTLGWGANEYFYAGIASIIGGLLIIILGLGYIFPFIPHLLSRKSPAFLVKGMSRSLQKIQSAWVLSLLMGLVSGLLPCGLLVPAYGLSLLSGDPGLGALTMVIFSLGTYPMLFTLGLFGRKVIETLQNSKIRILVGIILILFGLFTIFQRANMKQEDPDCHVQRTED